MVRAPYISRLPRIGDMSPESATLLALLVGWSLFYLVGKTLRLQERGWDLSPYYALYKSTSLNRAIEGLASLAPGGWRLLGNVGVAASLGQAGFITLLLLRNLWNFFYTPEKATPVQPLIPGVTVRVNSLPWFLLAAGIVILTHELGHGIMCRAEGVRVRSAAILLAVVTFGGAVEPEEEDLRAATPWSRMRIYAVGSLVNLLTGLATVVALIVVGGSLPPVLRVFGNWLYFVSINLALMNMLPIGPLDGGQMWREFTARYQAGSQLQKSATYAFTGLIVLNILLSLNKFGLVSI